MSEPCSTYQRNSGSYSNSFCAANASASFFRHLFFSAGALQVILHVLRYDFWDLLGEEEGRHFFTLQPQRFRDLYVHLCDSKSCSSFQALYNPGRLACPISIAYDLPFPQGMSLNMVDR